MSNRTKSPLSIAFIGCGNSTSQDLGNSTAVLTIEDEKRLAIDFGFTSYHAFKARYKTLPDAIYITHIHFDHIGVLQSLFYDTHLTVEHKIKLFIHYKQVAGLHNIIGRLDNIVA